MKDVERIERFNEFYDQGQAVLLGLGYDVVHRTGTSIPGGSGRSTWYARPVRKDEQPCWMKQQGVGRFK